MSLWDILSPALISNVLLPLQGVGVSGRNEPKAPLPKAPRCSAVGLNAFAPSGRRCRLGSGRGRCRGRVSGRGVRVGVEVGVSGWQGRGRVEVEGSAGVGVGVFPSVDLPVGCQWVASGLRALLTPPVLPTHSQPATNPQPAHRRLWRLGLREMWSSPEDFSTILHDPARAYRRAPPVLFLTCVA